MRKNTESVRKKQVRQGEARGKGNPHLLDLSLPGPFSHHLSPPPPPFCPVFPSHPQPHVQILSPLTPTSHPHPSYFSRSELWVARGTASLVNATLRRRFGRRSSPRARPGREQSPITRLGAPGALSPDLQGAAPPGAGAQCPAAPRRRPSAGFRPLRLF